jgi:hypothetical protein
MPSSRSRCSIPMAPPPVIVRGRETLSLAVQRMGMKHPFHRVQFKPRAR